MERPWARLQSHNQRTPLLQVLLKVGEFSPKGECSKPVHLQVVLHLRGVRAFGLVGIDGPLDLNRVRQLVRRRLHLALPVLHHHRDNGCAASVLLLLYKRHVKPDPRRCKRQKVQGQDGCDTLQWETEHTRILAHRHDNEHQDGYRQQDEDQIAIAQAPGREIRLGLFRTCRQLREVLIT